MEILDTIAAVSTPRGKGGVALLRVSGADAVTIAARVFRPKNGKDLSEAAPRAAVYGSILAPSDEGWQTIDDGLATVFRAPASFTGEDTVEICCHGGILLTETVLAALLAAGARAARAGEFTRRAFLNGKLGLSAAEALGSLLEAQNREQLTLAHSGMAGKIETRTRRIYEKLRTVLSSVLACIDFPDEDLAEMSRAEMTAQVRAVQSELRTLAATYRTGHAIAEGIPTVICGRPNVGKSSLYNLLVGRDAAIVTEIEGTTRDVLTETTALGRVTLRLFDTAGLRESDDRVERIGVERARTAMREAELILAVFDATREPDEEEIALAEQLASGGKCVIGILNKSDLSDARAEAYEKLLSGKLSCVVAMSAATGAGKDALCRAVEDCFIDGKLNTGDDAVLVNARQHAAVLQAEEAVSRALAGLDGGYPVDLCCVDLEAAMSSLSQLDGREVDEDIVSEIFSHFCVGK